jgi:outer membrane protein assembly factor BamE (lipoprotein component of BamABCDE complex)
MNFARSLVSSLLSSAVMLAQGCTSVPPPLGDKQFATVRTGMTTDEVRNALGEPKRTMKFPSSNNVAWDYEGTDTWGYMVEYSVTFGPDGRAVSKLARRLNDGGERK